MTPDKKANYLVQKYIPFAYQSKGNSVKVVAKEAATICCDEMIEEIEDLQSNCMMEFPLALEYWQSVKEEIQKL